jgi:gliding motility-associated-like protein
MHKQALTFLLLFIFTTGYTQYFSTQGTAQLTSNNPVTYRITPNSNTTSGLITNYFPLDLSASFELNFDMNFGSLDGNGADGMTFFLSNLCSPGLTSGGGLGIPAVNNLLVVEFDTYDNDISNGDIPQDHIGIYKSGFPTLSNLIIQGQTAPVCMLNNCGNVEDNTFIPIRIKWIYTSATQQKLEVYVNDILRATSTTANHIANTFLGNNTVFWSISGSTGGLSNLQQVRFPSISSSIEDCIGSVVPLSAPLLGSNYVWSNNSSTTNSANYTISSSQSVNCSYTDFCGQTKSIGFNLLPHIIPTPTVEITQPDCGTSNGKIKILSPLNNSSLPIPSDLFISEVSDHDPGSLTYIEIYNGTGVSKNLANYKIKVYNNGNTFTSCDFPLSGILLNNDVYVIAIGSSTNEGGVIPDLVVSTCSGINTNDNIRLTSNTNTEIDLWGRADGNDFTPNDADGYVYRRLVTAPHPSLIWNPADWNAIDPQDYSNIGTYLYQTNSFEYSINGTNYQSNVLFTGLPAGSYNVIAHELISGCYSSVLNVQLTEIRPAQPTQVNCWDNFVFNTTTCTWVNNGSQPAQPTPINCWDNFVFNATTCLWNNTGTQPAQPAQVNCWDNFVFNATTCVWNNIGSQPAQPAQLNCWDIFVFNATTCVWNNTGTQPAQPAQVNCWDNFVFNATTCVWNNSGSQPAQPAQVNCWDIFVFNTTTCVWNNTGSQPAQPAQVNCWDNFVFNTTTCVWNNTGTQPAQPAQVNCWDNFVFNATTCLWNNIGSQPVAPTIITTPPTCFVNANATISNFIATNTYIFTPSGPTVNSTGSISGMTFGTNYTVTSGIGGCISLPSASFSINAITPILPIFAQVNPVCQGATINIPTSSLNTPPIVGVWNLISSTANDVTYEFTPNPGQCALTTPATTMTIVVHPLPTVIPSVTTQSFCSGGTTNINLSSNVPGHTFSWTATATTITGQSGSVTGSGATSINQTLVLNPNQVAAGQVTYVIVAEANGCLGAPVTVVVTVNPIPNVIVSPASLAQTICSGQATNISFSGAINNTVYSWSVVSSVGVSGALNASGAVINQILTTTGLSQGTVVYEVTPSLNGCTGTPQRITVTVNPVPVIFGSATHPDLCSGESTFISVSTFNAATVFNWTVDPVGVSGASAGTNSGLSINIAQPLTTTGNTRGYVDYIITPVLTGCPGIPITVRVYVDPLPVVSLTDGTICVDGAGVPFQTYVLDSGLNDVDYDFVWTFQGNTIPVATIPGAISATYTATQVGTYTVVATNSTTNCFSNIASAVVTATNPATSLTVTQSEYFSDNATLVVTVTGGNGTLLYQLDQGALQESNVFTGVTGGTHDITVADTQGCTYLTQKVLVIDYPKYFTPNGDGYNDTWNIIGLNQPDAKLYIFDRYGKLLKQLSATTASEGWNGIYNNEKLPSTDYWFTLDYTENGTKKQFKAHFSLKR